ncbi:hypothetical protein ACFY94_05160 [Streptomyces griseorubiginosus]|uniref:hypothetical protein n=1 Tax=Streptomyces griseorubiginosus TaxID=67304 RepID=UPI0036E3FE24
MQPVLESYACEGFALWPVAESTPYGLLALSGALALEEVGTAVMCIADHNNFEPDEDDDPPRPAEPLGRFLHGLLTREGLAITGGLQITDTATGTTFLPGCCNDLDGRLDWLEVLDGDGWASFGHNPAPLAERHARHRRPVLCSGLARTGDFGPQVLKRIHMECKGVRSPWVSS